MFVCLVCSFIAFTSLHLLSIFSFQLVYSFIYNSVFRLSVFVCMGEAGEVKMAGYRRGKRAEYKQHEGTDGQRVSCESEERGKGSGYKWGKGEEERHERHGAQKGTC